MDKDQIDGPDDPYEILASKALQLSEFWLVVKSFKSKTGLKLVTFSLDLLIEDIRKCLDDKYFKSLLNKEWLQDDLIASVIIGTSDDYMTDLNYLRKKCKITMLVKWHNRIKAEYIKALFQK